MTVEKSIEILNSEEIAGTLKGAIIKKFWVEPIKGKKKMVRVHIQTSMPVNPLITVPIIITSADIREDCNFKEYSLSTLKFDVRIRDKGYLV